jgi:hypothetical protein
MNRRFVAVVSLLFLLASVVLAEPARGEERGKPVPSITDKPIALKVGPHLLLDDYLIARSEGVERKVMQPERFLAEPVVTSKKGHQNWGIWYTVLYDPTRPPESRFRMWYVADINDDPADLANDVKLVYLESADGIHWPGPLKVLKSGKNLAHADSRYGASVLDDGPNCAIPAERYKMVYWTNDGKMTGPVVAFSPDGLTWTMHNGGQPVLNTKFLDDSWHAGYDPIRKRYFMFGKDHQIRIWGDSEGRNHLAAVRTLGPCYSEDFKNWSPLNIIFVPMSKDPGVTQFYATTGFHARGDLMLGFIQILRDDLSAEEAPQQAVNVNFGNPGAGMGYTTLTWTRDGETWKRDYRKDAFLNPNPNVGTWDHAMSWVSSVAPVGDELYIYYAGFRWGHKHQRSIDRQIGLVKMMRDRYVARQAGEQEGVITTPLVTMSAKAMTLNADAVGGEVRLQVTDAEGKPLPGFSFADCQPIESDALDEPVQFHRQLSELKEKAVHLEFKLRNARLFAFSLSN